jgi:hypothetical protein
MDISEKSGLFIILGVSEDGTAPTTWAVKAFSYAKDGRSKGDQGREFQKGC